MPLVDLEAVESDLEEVGIVIVVARLYY